MKVLVTGGGGFLGQALCRALVERGIEVASFQRSYHAALEKIGVRQIQGDLANVNAVAAACVDQSAVFHVAAKAGAWGSYKSYYSANVRGTENVIAGCHTQAIRKLVYTSTPSVTHSGRRPVEGGNEINTPYGIDFKAAYPATKVIAEKAVLAANGPQLATVALRPRLIWGPGDNQLLPRLVARAQAGRLRLVDHGNNKIDTTYIDNAVQAHLDAFDHLAPGAACAGQAYFISNGEPMPAHLIINALLRTARAAEVSASLPYPLAYGIAAVMEMTWRLLNLKNEPPLTRFLAEQLSTPHWYDISAAKRDFGYVPRISIAEGLRRTAQDWLTQHTAVPADRG